jgi:uncharacterized protein (DUF2235 family)
VGDGMPKNIVICCDGTANEFSEDQTNVVKLFFALTQDPSQQIAFYHPGIGTMEPPGALTPLRRRIGLTLGQAIGAGIESDIRDAYIYLMRSFEPGDRVFLSGFSRGAYTVRALASVLRMYGLIRSGNEPLVPYAIRMLMGIHRAGKKTLLQWLRIKKPTDVRRLFKLADEFKASFCAVPCQTHFMGVWDTVSSVGWIGSPVKLPYSADNSEIAIGRHAVAIDERRAFFRNNLWHPTAGGGPQNIKQVWFPGVHCDVGGGYAENESGLSKLALEWMIKEAKGAGLLFDDAKVERILGRTAFGNAAPDANAKMHHSLTFWWWGAEFIPKPHWDWKAAKESRRANLFRRRTIPAGALVHQSAFDRANRYSSRLPEDAVPEPY